MRFFIFEDEAGRRDASATLFFLGNEKEDDEAE
jgi:hypothetical protein